MHPPLPEKKSSSTYPDLKVVFFTTQLEICPEMKVNEMQALYDKHHKVSSFPKSHQNTYNFVKYEVI